jgi:RNA polymerase sigma factor (sigma-70 family)
MRERDERWRAAHRLRAQFEAAARRQGLTREEAEDVASEVVIRAAQYEELDTEQLHSWGKVVATRLAIDWVRKRPGPRLLARLAHFEVLEADPSDNVLDRAEADWIAVEAEALPQRQLAALRARAEGWVLSDIAVELECSYKSVESLTSRARSHLRAVLASSVAAFVAFLGGVRRLMPTQPGTALVAVAVTGLALAGLLPLPWAEQPPDTARKGDTGGQSMQKSRPLPSKDGPTPNPGIHAPSLIRPSTSIRSARQILVGQSTVGPVAISAIEQDRADTDRGLLQSTQDCVNRGIDVSTTYIGCRQDAAS